MKKIFIVLAIFGFLTFIPFKTSASYYADVYGTYMTYQTLELYYDFEFTGDWWANEEDTYIFTHIPVEESLEELIRFLEHVTPYFMDIYNISTGVTYEYLYNVNGIPDNNIGWTQEDGHILIIVKQDVLDNGVWDTPLENFGDLAELIYIDTWVVTETSPDYEEGYDLGYNNGYTEGYNEGFNSGDEQGYDRGYYFGFNNGYNSGYDQGYNEGIQDSEGYEQGYEDGANESFIGSIDKWLVPAVIIVMILGGFFAIARKKRDGDI